MRRPVPSLFAARFPWLAGLAELEGLGLLVDHTLLRPETTGSEIARLCEEAAQLRFGAVCVNGAWVRDCVRRLDGAPGEGGLGDRVSPRCHVHCGEGRRDRTGSCRRFRGAGRRDRSGRGPLRQLDGGRRGPGPGGRGCGRYAGQGDPGERATLSFRAGAGLPRGASGWRSRGEDFDRISSRRWCDRSRGGSDETGGGDRDGREGVGRNSESGGCARHARGRRRPDRQLGRGGLAGVCGAWLTPTRSNCWPGRERFRSRD